MAAPFGCWKDATSTPFSVVLVAALGACIAVDMRTAEPGGASPVPVSGPESSWSSRGECPSAGLGAEDAAEADWLAAVRRAACAEPPAGDIQ